jgi:hypothetical protein
MLPEPKSYLKIDEHVDARGKRRVMEAAPVGKQNKDFGCWNLDIGSRKLQLQLTVGYNNQTRYTMDSEIMFPCMSLNVDRNKKYFK